MFRIQNRQEDRNRLAVAYSNESHAAPKRPEHAESIDTIRLLGPSGKSYQLRKISISSLDLNQELLLVLVQPGIQNSHIRWVGSSTDLISDPAIRNGFMKAVRYTRFAYVLPCPADETEQLTVLWELERGTLSHDKTAA